jgi:hypothetical protein
MKNKGKTYSFLEEYLGKERLEQLEVSIFDGIYSALEKICKDSAKYKALFQENKNLKSELHLIYRDRLMESLARQMKQFMEKNRLNREVALEVFSSFDLPTTEDLYDNLLEKDSLSGIVLNSVKNNRKS